MCKFSKKWTLSLLKQHSFQEIIFKRYYTAAWLLIIFLMWKSKFAACAKLRTFAKWLSYVMVAPGSAVIWFVMNTATLYSEMVNMKWQYFNLFTLCACMNTFTVQCNLLIPSCASCSVISSAPVNLAETWELGFIACHVTYEIETQPFFSQIIFLCR